MSADITPQPGEGVSSLGEAHFTDYANGELIWAVEGGSLSEPSGRLKEEEIVLVVTSPAEDGRHLVYSLSGGDDPNAPPKLSSLSIPSLPQELEQFSVSAAPGHLVSDPHRQLHIIVSTRSGLRKAEGFWSEVLRPLLTALGLQEWSSPEGHGYQVVSTRNQHSVRDFAYGLSAGRATANTIVLLSGDGGTVDLLNGADETQGKSLDNTVALLPLGTGNALFHSLNKPHYLAKDKPVPSSFVLGLRTLFRGTPAPLPTFKAAFSPGSHLVVYAGPDGEAAADDTNPEDLQERTSAVSHLISAVVASYGFHANLVWESDTPEYRKHGAKRFGMAAQELLKLGHSYTVRVDVRRGGGDAAEWTELTPGERFDYVLATPLSNLEKTFTISPASKPLDGQLRLVHWGDVGGDRSMQIMMAAYQEGAHLGLTWDGKDGEPEGKVGYEAIEALRVSILEEDPRWRKVCIDGTIVEIPKGGWMEVTKTEDSRLKVLADRHDV
ncbi:hypothetical protein GQ53DRAFT_709326 [Thozetella sp. PMI_491]|nr:hypothetical protein GQ53DRAFT_709326 [Thozetella sp. PMI_491]